MNSSHLLPEDLAGRTAGRKITFRRKGDVFPLQGHPP